MSTLPTKIPRGQMCLHCSYLYEDCSNLPFDSFFPIEKVDKEGYLVVKCGQYEKYHRVEFS